MIYSANKLTNPSGDSGTTGWTTSGTVTIDGGFKLTGAASIEQMYTVPGSYEAEVWKLSGRFKISESMGRLYTGTPGYLRAIIRYTDDSTQRITIPLRADVIVTRDVADGWTAISGEIAIDSEKVLKNVTVKAYTLLTTQSITLREISLKSGASPGGVADLTEAYEYTDSVAIITYNSGVSYTDGILHDILDDIETALGIILGT